MVRLVKWAVVGLLVVGFGGRWLWGSLESARRHTGAMLNQVCTDVKETIESDSNALAALDGEIEDAAKQTMEDARQLGEVQAETDVCRKNIAQLRGENEEDRKSLADLKGHFQHLGAAGVVRVGIRDFRRCELETDLDTLAARMRDRNELLKNEEAKLQELEKHEGIVKSKIRENVARVRVLKLGQVQARRLSAQAEWNQKWRFTTDGNGATGKLGEVEAEQARLLRKLRGKLVASEAIQEAANPGSTPVLDAIRKSSSGPKDPASRIDAILAGAGQ